MIWALAIRALGFVRSAAQSAFALARAYPMQAALIASLCLSGWLWMGKRDALAERDAAMMHIEAIKQASAHATRNAILARDAQVAFHKARAERTDNEADKLRSDYAGLTDRFIAANRVRRNPACPTSGTVAASGNSGAESADRSGGETELVAVMADDVRICSTNTARLEAARDWALGLNP